jgi:hypothetical protein
MMTRKWATIAMGAIVAGAIGLPIVALANPLSQYGTGQLTPQQSNILIRRELAWPQSYGAVVSRLGYPQDSDQWADYYTLVDGRTVSIGYSSGYAVYAGGL